MASVTFYITDLILNMDISVLNFISCIYFGTAVIVFLLLIYGITAPYGRYSRNGWGIQVNGQLAWFIQEIPSFAVPVLMAACNHSRLQNTPNLILFSAFLIHYFHRSCIFPFLIKGGKPTPFIPFAMALSFCVVNGYLQSAYLISHADYGHDWWTRRHIWIGLALFVSGMAINIHSDHILRNLRKPGETGYKIPTGGTFEYVSGANFFGEMLEWAGFAVATWGLPALAFAFFTWSNIGPRAYQHHKYYQQKFEDYPKSRKAVIPFLI